MDYNLILKSREEKSKFVSKFTKEFQVVTLRANIPGEDKNIYISHILIGLFSKILDKLNPIKTHILNGFDGCTYVYLFNKDKCLKEKLEFIEENFPLGRFVDIDCYYNSNVSLSRINKRKCYICNDLAVNCSRSQKHSYLELINYMDSSISNYLFNLINNLIIESIFAELDLDIKFGLVSKSSNGSHKDMDYNLMAKAANTITPYLCEMFVSAYKSNLTNPKDIFIKAKEIGIKADNAMFKATNNINCYQGLIFNLGLILTSLAINLKSGGNLDTIFEFCKDMVIDININYGAIGEAKLGYSSVKNILNKYDLTNKANYRYALMDLIINVDDTILAKRLKDKKSQINLKNKFKEALNSKDSQLINSLNEYCELNNLSFGGCADLLIVAIFLAKFNSIFNFITL